MDTELPSYLGLAQASFQQTSCFEAPLLETIEITSYACWISHVPNAIKEKSLCQLYYVSFNSEASARLLHKQPLKSRLSVVGLEAEVAAELLAWVAACDG